LKEKTLLKKEQIMPMSQLIAIEKEAEKLSIEDHVKLIETLIRQLRKKGLVMYDDVGWADVYGLGKDLWQGRDAQEYVDDLREDRQ
jgi:hypothetical protein